MYFYEITYIHWQAAEEKKGAQCWEYPRSSPLPVVTQIGELRKLALRNSDTNFEELRKYFL